MSITRILVGAHRLHGSGEALSLSGCKNGPRINPSSGRPLYSDPLPLSPYKGQPNYFDSTDTACEWLYQHWIERICNEGLPCFFGRKKIYLFSYKVSFAILNNREDTRYLQFSCKDNRPREAIPANEDWEDGAWIFLCKRKELPLIVEFYLPSGDLIRQGKCIEQGERDKLPSLVIWGGPFTPGRQLTINVKLFMTEEQQLQRAAEISQSRVPFVTDGPDENTLPQLAIARSLGAYVDRPLSDSR